MTSTFQHALKKQENIEVMNEAVEFDVMMKIMDGTYGSANNQEMTKAKNTKLITTA